MPDTIVTPVDAEQTTVVADIPVIPGSLLRKIQQVRALFAQDDVKKTGRNDFSKYDYFELSDFLPTAQIRFNDVGVCPIVIFAPDRSSATMYVYDMDASSAPIVITSPMGKTELKGAHDAQNVGAMETYVRRYLYMTLLELSEHDAVEETGTAAEIDVLISQITKLVNSILAKSPAAKPNIATAIRSVIKTAKYDTLKAGDEEKAKAIIAELEKLEPEED